MFRVIISNDINGTPKDPEITKFEDLETKTQARAKFMETVTGFIETVAECENVDKQTIWNHSKGDKYKYIFIGNDSFILKVSYKEFNCNGIIKVKIERY